MPDVRVDPIAAVDAAMDVLGDIARRDVPIGPLTTYRVGGAAAVFVTITSLEQLERVGEAVRVSELPVVVLGRGSNLLVADAGFAGIVVSATAVTDRFEIDVDPCAGARRGVGAAARSSLASAPLAA